MWVVHDDYVIHIRELDIHLFYSDEPTVFPLPPAFS